MQVHERQKSITVELALYPIHWAIGAPRGPGSPTPLAYADTHLRHSGESTLLRNRAFRVIADRDVQLVYRIARLIASHETLALEA